MNSASEAIQLETEHGPLDATWLEPDNARAVFVFSHGAGADHRHASMEAIATHLAQQEIATLRYNFPFMQARKRRVDSVDVAVDTIATAVERCRQTTDLPLYLCGHSFGGRMNSHAVAEQRVTCEGLVYCSFPLHAAKKPDTKRAQHLSKITTPMLFLSGTRDDLADADLLTDVVATLPQAKLHWLETANHSYVILKRSRQNPQPIFAEIAEQARHFVDTVNSGGSPPTDP